ncbi:MMPL family transporter [Pseudolysinimonas yzui]|uniref:Membrane protein n=1 Tax=Pseudolysinimonas yzui TaxID=2708254 RepID=A0A8J3M1N0_9MICO|nr:MMPL family transporter [Pseudolysinimonas yzui]GHF14594.1 membrane protein [Pseudolysinimonas yzui]
MRPTLGRRILRAVVPALLIVGWLALAGFGGPTFGKISDVSTNDQASFLPASAESTQVAELVPEFSGADDIPAIVIAARDGGLTDDDLAFLDDFAADAADVEGVGDGLSPVIPSDDGDAAEIVVPISAEIADTVAALTALLDDAPDGLEAYVTGPAGFTADLVAGFAGIDGILLLTALGAVLVILVIVYRSPLLPFIVLGTAVFALCAAILVVYWLAAADLVTINGQVQGILFILVIGAATDYALLYVARYREALRDHEKRWDATWAALRGSFEPILASGLTVIAGLLCLLLSDLNSNKALGPVAAIGIAFSLLAALTLLPALMLAAGRVAFWPRKVRGSRSAAEGDASRNPTSTKLWPAVGRLIAKRARLVWALSLVVLLIASAGLALFKADGVPQSELVLGESPARDGQVLLGEHFPAGSGSPAVIVGDENLITELADAAAGLDGVDGVEALSDNSPTGTMPVGTDAEPFPIPTLVPLEPTVVDGQVMLRATLTDAADSAAAEATIRELRDAVHAVDEAALVGGVTALAYDTDQTAIRDRTVIIPVVLLVILVILILLLRSLVAPLVLVASVIVSFAAALGVSALVFEGIFHFPGADPSVPLFGFVFLVALGVDYNIFLMTRVREESLKHGTREGVLRGLTVTGGVITSAGIVLAATFAALGVIPILFLAQIAFIVAFGVLLDTLVVRSLLVPAAIHDLGRISWWPSRLSRDDGPVPIRKDA